MNSRAVSTSGSITSSSEREVAVLRHLVRTFLITSKESNLDSFDTELFITETDRLPAIWDSISRSYCNKKCVGNNVQKKFIGNLNLLLYVHYTY